MFIVGSPRSGTTFLGGALGALPANFDAGELLATQIPELLKKPRPQAARGIVAGLSTGGVDIGSGSLRPVIHTPELVFLVPALLDIDPKVHVIHLVRDGRDVVSSLLDAGWLATRPPVQPDDERSRSPHWKWGDSARFWTEPDRTREFEAVSEARRGAWVWRRYVTAGLSSVADTERTMTIRYEAMCADPAGTARRLARFLSSSEEHLGKLLAPLTNRSVGRWRRDLSSSQLGDVYREAGELLRFLGFDSLPSAFDPDLEAIVSLRDGASRSVI